MIQREKRPEILICFQLMLLYHICSPMGNRRKRKRSKKRAKQKAQAESAGVLSAELREQLPIENGSNILVLDTDKKKRRPKKKKREEDTPRMSRKKAKLQRIKRRKDRERLLADMYTSLRQKKLGAVEVLEDTYNTTVLSQFRPYVSLALVTFVLWCERLLWCCAAGTNVEHTPSWPGKSTCVMCFPCQQRWQHRTFHV